MDISIESLTDLVAIHLGEFPDWRLRLNSKTAVKLDAMTRSLAHSTALDLTMRLPLKDCTSLRDIRQYLHDNTDHGNEYLRPCTLPDDYLRLHTLLMPDWPAPLDEENTGDPLRTSLGDRAPEWLSQHTLRPMIRITPLGDGLYELLYGPTIHTLPLAAACVPRPRLSEAGDTLMNIQPAILPELTLSIAKAIASVDI